MKKSLFHTLHKVYVVGWVVIVIGGMAWLYPRAGIAEPLGDWYEVWQNSRGTPARPTERLSGNVVRVLDATSFALRGTDRQVYNIGLAGVAVPSPKSPPSNADAPSVERRGPAAQRLKAKGGGTNRMPRKSENIAAQFCQARLAELVLSNDVEVGVASMDAARRGLGIVYVGNTNINALLVESGLVELRRDFIKGLPALEQYALIHADRKAKQVSTNAEK